MGMKIGEREIPMMLSTAELIDIQEEIGCTVGQLRDEVFGVEINFETEEVKFGVVSDPEKLKKFAKLIRIMGNAGLEEAGEEPNLTDKWILRHMKVPMIAPYVVAVSAVINEWMYTEVSQKKKDGPTDEILEEENRKKEQGS